MRTAGRHASSGFLASLLLLAAWLPALVRASSPDEARRAAAQGNLESLRSYLDSGGPTELDPAEGPGLLHLAAEQGHAEVVGLLLARGADHSARDQKNCTPLHLAAVRGHLEATRALLDGGAFVDAPGFSPPDGPSESTPLILAAETGAIEVVQLLVERGANVNAVNAFDRTPLFWAKKARKTPVAEFLEAQGAVADPGEALAAGGVRTSEIVEPPPALQAQPPDETETESETESEPEDPQEPAPETRSLPVAVPSTTKTPTAPAPDLRLQRQRGIEAWKAGKFAAAARALIPVVKAAPRDSLARGYLTLALWNLGKKEAARAQLQKLVKLDPERARKVRAKMR